MACEYMRTLVPFIAINARDTVGYCCASSGSGSARFDTEIGYKHLKLGSEMIIS